MKKFSGVILASLLLIITLITFSLNKQEALSKQEEVSTSVFSIYTVDSENMSLIKETELRVSRKKPDIKESLDVILNTISEDKFNGLDLYVDSIVKEEDKDIAVIKLEDKGIKNNNWEDNYFKDSAKGKITETILIENILQREIEGDWIDGVKFLYKGKEIKNKNVPLLGEVNYR